MSIVWVVMTDRIYDGDSIYGVFNSREKAEQAKAQINDPDVGIKSLLLMMFIPRGIYDRYTFGRSLRS
jgi:hypothetical protein